MARMVKGIIGGDDFSTEILVRGLTVNGPADAYCVGHCTDLFGSRLAAKCGVHYVKNIFEVIPNSAILFLTFSPEEANVMLPKIAEKVNEWTLIVSAVYGLKLSTLEYFFPHNEIVRLVYNVSIASGAGLSAYAVSANASTDAKSMAEIVLKDCGEVIAVANENELEAVADYLVANTYLSYVVMQSMVRNAKKIGMTPKEADSAVEKLLAGSMKTILNTDYDMKNLINNYFKDKAVHENAVELIKNYGIDEDLSKELTHLDLVEESNPNDDPKNYKMHYSWSR